MADGDWDKLPDGNVMVQPVLGYAIASLPKAALLRVVYAATQADFEARRSSAVQLAMTPQLARAMARTLTQIADAMEPPSAEAAAAPATGPAPAEILLPPHTDPRLAPPANTSREFDYSIGDDPEELTFDYRI